MSLRSQGSLVEMRGAPSGASFTRPTGPGFHARASVSPCGRRGPAGQVPQLRGRLLVFALSQEVPEMWLRSSGLPLSPASLPVTAATPGYQEDKLHLVWGLDRLCSGQGAPTDFPAVDSSISFPGMFLRSRIFWKEGNSFVLRRKLCRHSGSR